MWPRPKAGSTPRRRLYEQVLAMRRRTLGPTHPQVAWTLASMAGRGLEGRRACRARRFADEAVAISTGLRRGRCPNALHKRSNSEDFSWRARAGCTKAGRSGKSVEPADRASTARPSARGEHAGFARRSGLRTPGRRMPRLPLRWPPSAKGVRICCSRRAACPNASHWPMPRDGRVDSTWRFPRAGRTWSPTEVLDALIRSRGLILDELAARAHALQASRPRHRRPTSASSRRGSGSPTCWFAASTSPSRAR